MFDFEKLEVYNHLRQTARKVLGLLLANRDIDAQLSGAMRQATVNMIIHLTAGTGHINNADKKALYINARASAFEAVAILQLIYDQHMISESEYTDLYTDFETASKMLLGMVRSYSQ